MARAAEYQSMLGGLGAATSVTPEMVSRPQSDTVRSTARLRVLTVTATDDSFGSTRATTATGLDEPTTGSDTTTILREEQRRRWQADAAADDVGSFLLMVLQDRPAGLRFEEIASLNTDGAPWVSVARLIRSGLVDENGRSIYLTPSGRETASELGGLFDRGD